MPRCGWWYDRRMRLDVQMPKVEERVRGERLRRVMARVAEDAEEAIKIWYRRLPEDWFDSKETEFADGTPKHGRGRTFMRPLAMGWKAEEVSGRGFSLAFRAPREGGTAWGLRLQEYGGEVKPKNARALTIPLTAEARGRRAREFSMGVHRLFAVGRREGERAGTLVWEDEAGMLHAAYALRRRVKVAPLVKRRGHHGVPQEDDMHKMLKPLIEAALREE